MGIIENIIEKIPYNQRFIYINGKAGCFTLIRRCDLIKKRIKNIKNVEL